MTRITEKELSALGDLMSLECTLKAKCESLAEGTGDQALAACYRDTAARHAHHLEELFANLK
ncbi:MAG: hypothetical protein E7663_03315 [Ruminococcaceae bacterium]|nr:hypothetical protein [Oscillospiraceae bacterium]